MSAFLQPQNNEFEIRKMTLDDLVDVYAIETMGQVVPWSQNTFRDCLVAGYDGWVFIQKGNIEGYILAYTRLGECHILNFCVNPTLRSRGIGNHLLQHVLQHAKRLSADTAVLEVRPSNLPAIHLYRKCGFNEVSVRKDYYATPDGGREDALVLMLEFAHYQNESTF